MAVRPRRGVVWRSRPFKKKKGRLRQTRRGGGYGRGLPREARSFYTMDDLECQIFIQIYREKITETIDLSSPSFLDASVKTFYKHYLYQFQSHS